MFKFKNKNAFTLIELIVVMAIIGILVLLAMPKFMGYTEKARLTQFKADTKQLENASERYYIDKNDWPRLSDTPYTADQVTGFATKIKDKTGQIVTLDASGSYYDISYDKLQPYVQKPKNNIDYIIQNPVGEIFYLEGLTTTGQGRLASPLPPTISGYTNDLTVPTGNITASSSYSTRVATRGFDNKFSDYFTDSWESNAMSGPEWLMYNFGTPKRIEKYTIMSGWIPSSPKNWVFQGSNNGTSWTTLDTINNQTAWTIGEIRTYTFANSNTYSNYRIYVSAINGDSYCIIGEMEMMEGIYK